MSALVTLPVYGYGIKPNRASWIKDGIGGDLNPLWETKFNRDNGLPAVNIRKAYDAYTLEMAVPGRKRSDFKIYLENRVLTISARLVENGRAQNGGYTCREFGYPAIKRSFALPEWVDDTRIKANYKDGLLFLQLPIKVEARPKSVRNIKIQ